MIFTTENTSEIGKPIRVFVNGNEIDSAVFADTERGVVRYMPRPYRVQKGTDHVYTRVLHGVVTVEDAH